MGEKKLGLKEGGVENPAQKLMINPIVCVPI